MLPNLLTMRHTSALLVLAIPLLAPAQGNQGPDAPLVTITYAAGTGFTFSLSNPITSTNYMEMYAETISPPEATPDPVWRFQGYVITQFASEADMDDSVHLVVLDPDRARPAMIVDLSDTVTQVTYNTINGSDSCASMTWVLANAGTSSALSVSIDPFTLAPYHEDSTYCFLVQAFATNPYHLHPTCGTPEQIIVGWQSPIGVPWYGCVSSATVGVQEPSAPVVVIGPQPTADRLSISFPQGGTIQLRCFDSRGRIVHDRGFAGSTELDVRRWAAGTYALLLTGQDGKSSVHRFEVVR